MLYTEIMRNRRYEEENMLRRANRSKFIGEFKIGDKVMYKDPKYKNNFKGNQPYEGPYWIKRINRSGNYVLVNEDQMVEYHTKDVRPEFIKLVSNFEEVIEINDKNGMVKMRAGEDEFWCKMEEVDRELIKEYKVKRSLRDE